MLSDLFVKNFQSHEEAHIEFVPGVNAIVGDPNAGKTALLRALQWVVTNRPLSDGFIRRGSTETLVQLVLTRDDGLTAVTRVRGKDVNTYSLVDTTQDAEYTAFGTSPPEDVLKALNFSELNYQAQLAPYFLVFDSPGAVAGYIRAATGLEDVKEVIDILGRKHRTANGIVKDREASLEELEHRLQSLNRLDTDRLEKLIVSAEGIQVEEAGYAQRIQSLTSVVTQLREVAADRIMLPDRRLQEISGEVATLSTEFTQTGVTLSALEYVIHNLCEVQGDCVILPEERIQEIPDEIVVLSAEFLQICGSLSALESVIGGLCEVAVGRINLPDDIDDKMVQWKALEAQYITLGTQVSNLHNLVSDLVTVQQEGAMLVTQLQIAGQERQELKAQLSECPSCGSMLTDDTKRTLLGEMS